MPATLTLDAFLTRRAADRRLARLTHDVGLPAGRGLEFGPANNPTPLPSGMDMTVVDHRRDACAGLPDAVAIDHAWAGSGSLAAVLGGGGYDFAIAAQVAQYVPNLLGWLRGIHEVLRPGGVLNLALPDKRFMFDAGRPESTLAELVEADLLGLERPSLRQLFAHASQARAIAPEAIWAGADPHRAARTAQATAGYVLCHCWVFTPASLLERLAEATRLGLFSFVLNQISATEPGGYEFFVSMRRAAQDEPEVLLQEQAVALDHLRAMLERRRRTAALLAT